MSSGDQIRDEHNHDSAEQQATDAASAAASIDRLLARRTGEAVERDCGDDLSRAERDE